MNTTGRSVLHRGVALLLGAVVLTTCGGGDGDSEQSASTTEATEPDGTTTTTVPAAGPEEWVEVVRGFFEAEWQALIDSDPELLREIYVEDYGHWDDAVAIVESWRELAEADRVEGEPNTVLEVDARESPLDVPEELEDEFEGWTIMELLVRYRYNPPQMLGSDGEPTGEEFEPFVQCIRLTVVPAGPDGAWRAAERLPYECAQHDWETTEAAGS